MGQTYDPDAHDTLLGVTNDSVTSLLKIHQIIISSDTASAIQVFLTSGVTEAGTAVPGVNLNRGSGRTAEARAFADETGNGAQAAGYLIHLLHRQVAANTVVVLEVEGSIVLSSDDMIGVDLTTAATAGNVTILGWFEEIP